MEHDAFPQTDWSQVQRAIQEDPARARAAIVELCQRYRDAICDWFRRRPQTQAQAEDLAHEFITRWLTRPAPLGQFTRGHRRFRDYLSVSLRNFAQAKFARETAAKRGGGAVHEELDEETLSSTSNPPTVDGPDLEIARLIFREVTADMGKRWLARTSAASFTRLRDIALGRAPAVDYAVLSTEFRLPVGTIKGWIFRIRQEFHDGFRSHVQRMTAPEDVPGEMRHLIDLLLRHEAAPDGRSADPATPAHPGPVTPVDSQ